MLAFLRKKVTKPKVTDSIVSITNPLNEAVEKKEDSLDIGEVYMNCDRNVFISKIRPTNEITYYINLDFSTIINIEYDYYEQKITVTDQNRNCFEMSYPDREKDQFKELVNTFALYFSTYTKYQKEIEHLPIKNCSFSVRHI